MSDEQRKSLSDGEYEVYIDSRHFNGSLTYGEVIIPGASKKEVFLSTYIGHPSMANNELSSPTVVTYLCKWLAQMNNRRYTYRIVFIPETIGSITYLWKNLDHLKRQVFAGFNLTCIGDNRSYSYLPSRSAELKQSTSPLPLSDRVAKHVLKHIDKDYRIYSWKDRGSDERQYCAPHVNLPIASIMRTKYGEYEEYHTSLDDLENVVTPEGLEGGYTAVKQALNVIEKNVVPSALVFGEPQLGKRGLYPNVSTKDTKAIVGTMMDVLSYCDGKLSVLDIAEKCDIPFWKVMEYVELFEKHNLISIKKDSK